MNIVNKEFVFEMMRQRELPFFTVYDATGARKLYEQQDDTKSFSDAIVELEAVIEAQEGGQIVCIKVSEQTKREKASGGNVRKGQYEYRIRCGTKEGVSGTKQNNFEQTYVNNRVFELMEEVKRRELEILQLKNEHAIANLERKFEESNKESPLEKYMPAIISGLSGIMNKGAAPIQGIAGPPETIGEPKEDVNTKITEAVRRLYKVDKNLGDTLTSLADFAEKDPTKYLSFLPMLKNL